MKYEKCPDPNVIHPIAGYEMPIIGLGTWTLSDEVLSFANITPAVIQNENHIYYQNIELQEYVKQYGIVIESWYPFGGRGHTEENFNSQVAYPGRLYSDSGFIQC